MDSAFQNIVGTIFLVQTNLQEMIEYTFIHLLYYLFGFFLLNKILCEYTGLTFYKYLI